MGGGDGDGGAQERQAATEASKQAARDALNLQFGIGSDVAAPERSAFIRRTTPSVGQPGGDPTYQEWGGTAEGGAYSGSNPSGYLFGPATAAPVDEFDQSGYESAVAKQNSAKAAGAGRNALYQTVRDNAYNSGKRGLDESRDEAARKTKFELFARGLNGGSEDVNQNAMLGRTYNQGLIDLGAKADLAKSQFRGNDEQTRLGLLQSIDAGMDQGSAASSAMEQMRVNADRASAEAQGTSLGDLFANTGLIYNKGQAAQGKAAGTEWWNNYNPAGSRTSKAANGMISQV